MKVKLLLTGLLLAVSGVATQAQQSWADHLTDTAISGDPTSVAYWTQVLNADHEPDSVIAVYSGGDPIILHYDYDFDVTNVEKVAQDAVAVAYTITLRRWWEYNPLTIDPLLLQEGFGEPLISWRASFTHPIDGTPEMPMPTLSCLATAIAGGLIAVYRRRRGWAQ